MQDIKQQMKKGLLWTALDKYSGQIIGIVISMVLARLLTPYEYGVVATASVILGFLSIFTSLGIGPAIIQREDLKQIDLNNIFTFSILLGLILGGISFSSSWFIADYFGDPVLKSTVQILSVGIFLASINMVPSALMSKHQRFKEMATRNLTFQVIFGIVGVISAFWGAGIYALIFPQILTSLCTFIYNNHFYPVRVSYKFSLEPIKRIFSYSAYIFLFGFFNYFSRNLDKLIIGKYISADALGYYEKSYRLMQMPLHNITAVVDPVIQPIMSSLQNNLDEFSNKYSKMIGIIATASFPIGILLFFNANEIITVMFGSQWGPSVSVFKVLSLSIPTQVILSTSGSIFYACNATKQLFIIGTSNVVITVSLFLLTAHYGGTIEAIALGWTVASLVAFFNTYINMYNRIFKKSLSSMLVYLIKPLISIVLLISIYILLDFISININPFINLIIRIGFGLITLFIYLAISNQFNIVTFVKKILFDK